MSAARRGLNDVSDLEASLAQSVARGDVHPERLQPIEDHWPEYQPVDRSIPRPFSNSRKVGGSDGLFVPDLRIKAILGESSKGNVANGPMDAFVSRKAASNSSSWLTKSAGSRKTKSTPLPKAVGVFGSGPSLLSEQPSSSRLRFHEAGGHDPIYGSPLKLSKFFRTSGRTEELTQAARISGHQATELVWESSDDLYENELARCANPGLGASDLPQ